MKERKNRETGKIVSEVESTLIYCLTVFGLGLVWNIRACVLKRQSKRQCCVKDNKVHAPGARV